MKKNLMTLCYKIDPLIRWHSWATWTETLNQVSPHVATDVMTPQVAAGAGRTCNCLCSGRGRRGSGCPSRSDTVESPKSYRIRAVVMRPEVEKPEELPYEAEHFMSGIPRL